MEQYAAYAPYRPQYSITLQQQQCSQHLEKQIEIQNGNWTKPMTMS